MQTHNLVIVVNNTKSITIIHGYVIRSMMSFPVFKVDRNVTYWSDYSCKVDIQFLFVSPQAILLNHLRGFIEQLVIAMVIYLNAIVCNLWSSYAEYGTYDPIWPNTCTHNLFQVYFIPFWIMSFQHGKCTLHSVPS